MDSVLCTGRISKYLERNMLKDLKAGEIKYESVGEFLAEIKKEFRWKG